MFRRCNSLTLTLIICDNNNGFGHTSSGEDVQYYSKIFMYATTNSSTTWLSPASTTPSADISANLYASYFARVSTASKCFNAKRISDKGQYYQRSDVLHKGKEGKLRYRYRRETSTLIFPRLSAFYK